MSSFKIKAHHKATGEIHEIWCIDNYFAKREYGYVVNEKCGGVFTEKQFYNTYDVEEKK